MDAWKVDVSLQNVLQTHRRLTGSVSVRVKVKVRVRVKPRVGICFG